MYRVFRESLQQGPWRINQKRPRSGVFGAKTFGKLCKSRLLTAFAQFKSLGSAHLIDHLLESARDVAVVQHTRRLLGPFADRGQFQHSHVGARRTQGLAVRGAEPRSDAFKCLDLTLLADPRQSPPTLIQLIYTRVK